MKSGRFPKTCALAVIITGAALAVGFAATLPDAAATHFASSGAADGRMSRVGFAVTMLIICTGLPLALLFGLSALHAPPRPSAPASGRYSVPRAKGAPAIGPWAAALFASAFSIFMDFVAWRVWCTNRSEPRAGGGRLRRLCRRVGGGCLGYAPSMNASGALSPEALAGPRHHGDLIPYTLWREIGSPKRNSPTSTVIAPGIAAR